ncbi:Hypothetical protein D9617_6g092740 [Elsinoe fawcettii]|nr:Hypothetical protein D9617_6g092740 [Elsinoe fawcettii]
MALPIGIGDILALVEIAKDIYDKVKGVQEKVDKTGSQIVKLSGYLRNLQHMLVKDKGLGQDALRKDQVSDMEAMLKDIRVDVISMTKLLKDYRDKRGPLGSQFAVDIAHKVYFATGGGAKKLDELSDELEKKVKEIDQWTTQLNLAITQQILANQLKKQLNVSQPPSKTGVSILFIDKDNTGRGKVAEAYAKLVNQWTSADRNGWPAKTVHSVGLNVMRRNQCVELLEKQDFKYRIEGNQAPVEVAMQALFDNKLFNYPYKAKIQADVKASRSRGPELSLFKDYDYVLVFTRQMETNLVRLRQDMVKAGGQSVAPKGKGQIKLLGEYSNSKTSSIYHPVEMKNIEGELEKWKKTVSMIKVAYKGFLKKELGWVQPGANNSK